MNYFSVQEKMSDSTPLYTKISAELVLETEKSDGSGSVQVVDFKTIHPIEKGSKYIYLVKTLPFENDALSRKVGQTLFTTEELLHISKELYEEAKKDPAYQFLVASDYFSFFSFGTFKAFLDFPREIIDEREVVGNMYGLRGDLKRYCGWRSILISAKDEQSLTRFMFSFCYNYFDLIGAHIRLGEDFGKADFYYEHILAAVFGLESIYRIGVEYNKRDKFKKDPTLWPKVDACAKEVGNPAPFCIPKCEEILILMKHLGNQKGIDLKFIFAWF